MKREHKTPEIPSFILSVSCLVVDDAKTRECPRLPHRSDKCVYNFGNARKLKNKQTK